MSGLPAGQAIRFNNLTLGYDRHPAVHHLDGSVATSSLTAIVGPNGAGKSTLLKAIVGAIKPLGGDIALAAPSRANVAYLPQQAEIDRDFPINVFDLVAMGLWRWVGAWRPIAGRRKDRVTAALAAVGLNGFERRPIGALSGGEMQRTLFARLLLQDSPLILLDEPFTAIDSRTAADLLELVATWHGEGRTILAALHDLEQVRAHFPQTLMLAREPVAWGVTRDVLTTANLARARQLCEAWDDRAGVCHREERRA